MGEVGSARYEPALLPPCPSIRVLSYSNCQEIQITPADGPGSVSVKGQVICEQQLYVICFIMLNFLDVFTIITIITFVFTIIVIIRYLCNVVIAVIKIVIFSITLIVINIKEFFTITFLKLYFCLRTSLSAQPLLRSITGSSTNVFSFF